MQKAKVKAYYEAHGYLIHQRCKRILHDDEEAFDVCQETFIRLFEMKTEISASGIQPWLYRVATNLCIDKLRKHKYPQVSIRWEDFSDHHDDEKGALQRDLVKRLWQNLTEEEQSLLLLRYVDELSLQEMEEICGHTRKTISKRLKRLHQKARNLLSH